MRILIHGCYKREKYVYEHLIPSLKAQGVEDVRVWMDVSKEGNLKNALNSFRACSLLDGGTWHLQDDVIISSDFAKIATEHDKGLVCGFGNAEWEGGRITRTGLRPAKYMWFSFQCLRVPAWLAGAFYEWYYTKAVNDPEYAEFINLDGYDDFFFRKFIVAEYPELPVVNLNPNIVDHIDYLLGGTAIGLRKDGKPHRSAYWKDEKLIDDLKSIL